MIRRRTTAQAATPGPALTAVLLEGYGAAIPEAAPDTFDIFTSDENLYATWRRHQAWLVDEGRRRGIRRPFWIETLASGWPKDLDWELARSALHGAPLPEWAAPTWTPAAVDALRRRLLAILSDADGDGPEIA